MSFNTTSENTVKSELQQAIAHHQAGDFQKAEQHYLAVLQAAPHHADANYNMGIMALQRKQALESVPYFSAALEADPACGQFWLGYIDALFQSEQIEDARQLLSLARQQGLEGDEVDALEARMQDVAQVSTPPIHEETQSDVTIESARNQSQMPSHQEIDNLLRLFGKGRYEEALELARAMTEHFPLHEFGWKALGAIFKQMGLVTDSLEPMQKAVALAQGDVEAHFNLGVTLQELERFDEAEACYRQALKIDSGYVDAHANLGVVLLALGRLNEAEESCRRVLQLRPDNSVALMNLTRVLKGLGRLAEAEDCCHSVLETIPASVDALFVLADIYKMQGRLEEAEASYMHVLELEPEIVQVHFNLGNILKDMGRHSDAEQSYLRALQLNPDLAEIHYNLGNLLDEMGRPDEAELSYKRALDIKPDYIDAYNNLGINFLNLGRLDEAEVVFRQILQINAEHVDACTNLGAILKKQGKFDEAVTYYQRVLQARPDDAVIHYGLGAIFLRLNRLVEAETSLRRAIQIMPEYADAYSDLGWLLNELKRFSEAEATLRHALRINSDCAGAHYNLGVVLQNLCQYDEASECYLHVLKIQPDSINAQIRLGSICYRLGRLGEAVLNYQKALQIQPDNAAVHSTIVATKDFMADADVYSLSQERQRWNAVHAEHLHQNRIHPNIPDAKRRLRIGYVSADFRAHSASFVFGAMLVNFDREQFDVIAYSNSKTEDLLTQVFQKNVTCWKNIVDMSDDAVADLIRQDEIDILVDLSGHSVGNRLLVFARKPAPIQITAWGYAAGTGMSAMDVFFTDSVMVPPEEQSLYSERIRYLPCAITSYSFEDSPAVNPLPALTAKTITFGSFNRLIKNSDEAYKAWIEILHACPGSRMIFKAATLDDVNVRAELMEYFIQAGISSERIVLLGETNHEQHLAAFNQVDIALDPFPHGGGLTTLEGVVMGVPVVTLRWPTLPGRLSASVLTALGLTDWIAESPLQYVELAIKKASDLNALSELRQQLRGIFTSSILGDQVAYVRTVEREYRELWKEWCDSTNKHDV